MLFDSLVLRVMMISSGVTRRNSASATRVASFSGIRRARFVGEGSVSTLFDSRLRASDAGREAGQRFAAFITARSGGITNWSRTLFQKGSPADGPAGRMSPLAAISRAKIGSASRAAEPPTANSLAKLRRETLAAMFESSCRMSGERPEYTPAPRAPGCRRRPCRRGAEAAGRGCAA